MVGHLARAGPGFAADEEMLEQLLRRDRRKLRKRMRRRAQDLQLVICAKVGNQCRQMRRRLDEAQVQRVLGDPVLHGFRVGDDQARQHFWMARAKFAQHPRQQELGDRHAGTDEERACDLARHLLEARVKLRGQAEDALGVVEHDIARRSERDPSMAAIEQARVEVFFELLDLEGDCRLGHEQRFGCLGERKLPRHRMEHLETPVRHRPRPD